MSQPKTVLVQTRISREHYELIERRLATTGKSLAQWLRELVVGEVAFDVPVGKLGERLPLRRQHELVEETLCEHGRQLRVLHEMLRTLRARVDSPSSPWLCPHCGSMPCEGRTGCPPHGAMASRGLCAWGDHAPPSHRCPVHDGSSSRQRSGS